MAGTSAVVRVLVSFTAGVATFLLALIVSRWEIAALLGWDAAAVAFLLWVWLAIGGLDGDDTARLASREDSSRLAADAILIGATVVSLVAVGIAIVEASGADGPSRIAVAVVALSSLVLSWAAIHTVYTLRYAHLYYRDGGGIDLSQDTAPDYRDFAYVAFTIGMTYQVSDTTITSRAIRMAALKHAFLSFVFGTGVIATTINLVAGLYRG